MPPHHATPLWMSNGRWQWRLRRWRRSLGDLFSSRPGESAGGLSLTKVLIVTNLVLFVLMVLQGMAAGRGLSPLLNPDTSLLIHAGAQYWPLVLAEGQWWRCLTYAFTHAGLIHLGFNMVVLYQVGPLLEWETGQGPFLFLYTLTALTATWAGYLWHPAVPVVGASGSLFGLIGFAVVHYHRQGDALSLQRRNFMFQWAVFAFLFGLLVHADNAGHLGGALGGAMMGLLLPGRRRIREALAPLFTLLAVLSAAAILVSLVLLAVSWFSR